ncbi:hypothetical protein [Streptomyces sp. NPDC021212]|uniref:hypothetical protein n=1 Tax=Streptomyces sp. NPDC021212 TaxID=3365118 RepID=UPI0037B90117
MADRDRTERPVDGEVRAAEYAGPWSCSRDSVTGSISLAVVTNRWQAAAPSA